MFSLSRNVKEFRFSLLMFNFPVIIAVVTMMKSKDGFSLENLSSIELISVSLILLALTSAFFAVCNNYEYIAKQRETDQKDLGYLSLSLIFALFYCIWVSLAMLQFVDMEELLKDFANYLFLLAMGLNAIFFGIVFLTAEVVKRRYKPAYEANVKKEEEHTSHRLKNRSIQEIVRIGNFLKSQGHLKNIEEEKFREEWLMQQSPENIRMRLDILNDIQCASIGISAKEAALFELE